MTTPPLQSPGQALADGFAERVVQWGEERAGGTRVPAAGADMLRAAAHAVSLATSAGHVCTTLADLAAVAKGDPAAWRDALLASGMVATPARPAAPPTSAAPAAPGTTALAPPCPLILDDDGRLYLHRYFDYEMRLARRLMQAAATPGHRASGERIALLDRLFAANAERLRERPDWQKIATALSLSNRLTVISGGPGTGKTTTVVSLLACILAEDPHCRIALAAPTGKAAARMLEAIRRNATHLPAELAARLPATSSTVHRLLGATPGGGFRHDAGNPLPIDLLVVDEASMLDLALATRLVDAVPPAARIVLVGDKDQLAAVEAGAVFSELCADPTLTPACIARLAAATGIAAARIRAPAPVTPTVLRDCVVWLDESFRFAADSAIARLAAHVNGGDAPGTLECLRAGDNDELQWIDDAEREPGAATMLRVRAGMADYLDAARAGLSDLAALFEALGRFRLLCAEREGRRGVDAMNERIARDFRRALDHPLDSGARSLWYPGRPVMVLANDYTLKLYNGDIGVAVTGEDGAPVIAFPRGDGGYRTVAPLRLPRHETAFATTVHKAQGSEFDRVLLLLPARAHRVATRELLYTAVTRARRGVTIAGSADVVAQAVLAPTRRYSGLLARLADAAAGQAPGARTSGTPSPGSCSG